MYGTDFSFLFLYGLNNSCLANISQMLAISSRQNPPTAGEVHSATHTKSHLINQYHHLMKTTSSRWLKCHDQ